ncbi:DUF2500 domain-containing protein [Bacillus sp. E214]|uniref:DUF2500 domain-containing protein n=1 Tax=Bacillus sp. E214 TaxID=2587156 RepID=UPI0011E01E6F|nr:DUF2500 domain-containing protein [Bacillus sp. E214]
MDNFLMDDGGFFGIFLTGFPIIFGIIFILVIGTFLFIIIKSLSKWSHNNKQPRLNVVAKVVTKRSESRGSDNSSNTWYYATFEMESGDRMELTLSGKDYGMLAEGDIGNLSFQGTRYLGFLRI